MSDSSASDLIDVFSRADVTLSAERANALAQEINTYGGLEPAIMALTHDEAFAVLGDALTYRAIMDEQFNSHRQIARLLLEAQDLDARAAPAWAQAAEFMGRAAYRRDKGDLELAAQFQARALAAESLAADFEAQALRHRLQAAELKASKALCDGLRELAA